MSPGKVAISKLTIALLMAAGLWLACAKIEAPPGGPEDRQGPYLIGSLPLNGAVNVPRDNRISLYFSEPIKKPRSGKTVLISPRPSEDPKVRFKTDHLVIILPDSFDLAATYQVSATAGLTDLRGNEVDSGLTIAFSCGPTIDSGAVAGTVTDYRGKGVSGLHVGLFDESTVGNEGYDSLYADYITQTTKEGFFSFNYLPSRTYRLIAFRDADRNDRFGTYHEDCAVPDRTVVPATDGSLLGLRMTLAAQDSTRAEILGARLDTDGMVKLRLSKEVSLMQIARNLSRVKLNDVGPAIELVEVSQETADALTVYFGDLDTITGSIEVEYDSLAFPLIANRIDVSPGQDNVPPSIVSVTPGPSDFTLADSLGLEVLFSEPMDASKLTAGTFVLVNTDAGDTLGIVPAWRNPLRLALETDSIARAGKYRMDVIEFDLADKAGNTVGDSLTSFEFTVTSEEDLGWIVGTLACGLPECNDMSKVLSFRDTKSGLTFEHTMAAESDFTVAVPGGKYTVIAFLDRNGDGVANLGRPWPYQWAESVARPDDTIAVRARFETVGVEVTID